MAPKRTVLYLDDPRFGWDDWNKNPDVPDVLTAAGDFDESKVSRDSSGRFGPKDGGGDDGPVQPGSGDWHADPAVREALDRVPAGTAVLVSGAQITQHVEGGDITGTDPYVCGPAVMARTEDGVTVLRELPAGAAERLSPEQLQQHMADTLESVGATHGALSEAVGPGLAAQLNQSYAILNGPNPADAKWQEKFGNATFTSSGMAGQGQVTTFNGGHPTVPLVLHEAGHSFEDALERPTATGEWDRIQRSDSAAFQALRAEHGNYEWTGSTLDHQVTPEGFNGRSGITTYGTNSGREDFAEAFRLYCQDERGKPLGITFADGHQPSFAEMFPARHEEISGGIELLRAERGVTAASRLLTFTVDGRTVDPMDADEVAFYDADGAPVPQGDPSAVTAEITTIAADGTRSTIYGTVGE